MADMQGFYFDRIGSLDFSRQEVLNFADRHLKWPTSERERNFSWMFHIHLKQYQILRVCVCGGGGERKRLAGSCTLIAANESPNT